MAPPGNFLRERRADAKTCTVFVDIDYTYRKYWKNILGKSVKAKVGSPPSNVTADLSDSSTSGTKSLDSGRRCQLDGPRQQLV